VPDNGSSGGSTRRTLIPARGEVTFVGIATEVKIPWQTFVLMGVVLCIIVAALWCVGWLIWLQRSLKIESFGRWGSTRWWPWISVRWPTVLITLVLAWFVAALPYLYRLLIEQFVKNPPLYDNMSPDVGIWNPFGRQVYESEPEAEMDAETMNINLWDLVKERTSRKRMRRLPNLLTSQRARAFYRAIVNGTASFSEREAKRFGISRHKFNKNIRGALFSRRLADWKDERHKKQGIDLSDDALRTFEVLGKQAALPRNRA
jgi:hypothetical protein